MNTLTKKKIIVVRHALKEGEERQEFPEYPVKNIRNENYQESQVKRTIHITDNHLVLVYEIEEE